MPGDQIVLVGPDGVDLTFNYDTENDGSIQVDSGPLISYTDLEPIASLITPANVTLNYGGAAPTETITASDVGGGMTNVNSDVGGETTTFPHPTASLTINTGGGADIINVDGLNYATANVNLNDTGGNDDTLNFQTAPTNIGSGALSVTVPTTNINQPLTAGSVTINATGGTTTINTPTITTTGGQFYFDAVVLAADLVVSGNNVVFVNTVDGAFNLTLNDSAGPNASGFGANVGMTTPLASLTTDAAGATTIAADVTTTGPQSYNDPFFGVNSLPHTLTSRRHNYVRQHSR